MPSPRVALASLFAVFVATFVLDAGQGLLSSLVPLRLDAMGATAREAGLVGAAYFAGFVAGVWYGAVAVHRVGHIRAFGGFLALLAGFALALPLLPHVTAWALLRFLHGAGIAAVAMVIESWLTAVSPHAWRGRILALYTMLTYGGFAAGQFLLRLYDVTTYELFSLGAILLAASIVPVAFSRRIRAPRLDQPHGLSLRSLYAVSPLSLAGSLLSGLVLGAFLALGPLFGRRLGLAVDDVALMMAAAMLGGVLLEWPIGHLSDRLDRRQVLIGAAAAGALLAVAIAAVGVLDLRLLLAQMALFGGVGFALYPLSLAHATDHLTPGTDVVPIASALLVAYGSGAVLGPSLAGLAFDLAAGRGLFVFMAIACTLFAGFGLWRCTRRPAPAMAAQRRYVTVPEAETTTAVFELDPRFEPKQLELELHRGNRKR